MQRTRTLDLCYVLDGEIVLVLDTGEVALKQGDVAILNGANHAWSNRSNAPAIVILSQHSGVDEMRQPPAGIADRCAFLAPPPDVLANSGASSQARTRRDARA